MATLTIEGKKVNVDDAFLQLSPQDQSHAVDEIAKKLKIDQPQSSGGVMDYVNKFAEPITSLPETYNKMVHESVDQMGRGVDQLKQGDLLHGAANTAIGAMSYVGAPINAPIHTLIGEPVEENTGIPSKYTDFAVNMALPIPKHIPGISGAAKAAEAAPTVEQLDAAAKAGFQAPEVANLSVKPKAIQDWVQDQRARLTDAGIDENLAPKTWAILKRAESAPANSIVTGNNLQSLRRTFGRAAGTPDATERLAASKTIDALDKLLEGGITPDMVLRGDPSLVASIWSNARGNYAAARRSENLSTAIDRAQLQAGGAHSGANIDNATRQQIKSILNNPKARRGYSGDELRAMQQIVKGTYTGDVARTIGNMFGGGGGLGTIAASAAGAGAGAATHGPIGGMIGAALPVVGYVAKKIGNAITANNVAKLDELVRSRSPLALQMVRPMQKWDEAVTAYQASNTPRNVARLMIASRNLATNLKDAGIDTTAEKLISALQGPKQANADQENK